MSTTLTTAQYLALSEAAYTNLSSVDTDLAKDDGLISTLIGSSGLLHSKFSDGDHPQIAALSEISDWRLVGAIDSIGFSASAFRSPSGEIVFAFRGSDNLLGDWLSTDIAVITAQSLEGEVKSISPDAVQNEQTGALTYTLKVHIKSTTSSKDQTIALQSGMSVTSEIKTDDRRIISFFLDPLIKGLDTSLKSR